MVSKAVTIGGKTFNISIGSLGMTYEEMVTDFNALSAFRTELQRLGLLTTTYDSAWMALYQKIPQVRQGDYSGTSTTALRTEIKQLFDVCYAEANRIAAAASASGASGSGSGSGSGTPAGTGTMTGDARLVRVWYGQQVPFTTVRVNDLIANNRRVQFAVIYNTIGKYLFRAAVDGKAVDSKSQDVTPSMVGRETTLWFTYPSEKSPSYWTPGTHQISIQIEKDGKVATAGTLSFTLAAGGTGVTVPGTGTVPYGSMAEMLKDLAADPKFHPKSVAGGYRVGGSLIIPGGALEIPHQNVTAVVVEFLNPPEIPYIPGYGQLPSLTYICQVVVDGVPGGYTAVVVPKSEVGWNNEVSIPLPATAKLRGPHTVAAHWFLSMDSTTVPLPPFPAAAWRTWDKADRDILLRLPSLIYPDQVMELVAEISADGIPSNGESADLLVNNIKVATVTTTAGRASFQGAFGKGIAGSLNFCVEVPESTAAKAARKCASQGITQLTGRQVHLFVPLQVPEGYPVDLVAQISCGGAPSSGELVIFTVDGEVVGQAETSAGQAKVTWKASADPSRNRKICARVPRNAVCPGVDESFTCKMLTVLKGVDESTLTQLASERQRKYELWMQETGGVVGEKVGSLVPFDLIVAPDVTPYLPAPTIPTPTVPIPPTPSVPAPAAPEPPQDQPGKIIIPALPLPEKFAGVPIEVYVDNELLGSPPITLQRYPGTYSIRITAKGLPQIHRRVRIASNETVTLSDLSFT